MVACLVAACQVVAYLGAACQVAACQVFPCLVAARLVEKLDLHRSHPNHSFVFLWELALVSKIPAVGSPVVVDPAAVGLFAWVAEVPAAVARVPSWVVALLAAAVVVPYLGVVVPYLVVEAPC